MTTTTQQIETILAHSTEAMRFNSRGEGVIVGIPLKKRDGMPLPISSFYKRLNGEFVFLKISTSWN